MNCQEVQERLSEYLEQSLDDASMRTVDIHLSSCRLCRAEADSLVRCIQNIAGLPTVEPPLGFAQRVMSHVREIEARPSVWERLWFPLGIKMPIHATAIVLIAVLAIYLLEKEEPHKNLLTTPGHVASPSEKQEPAEPAAPANSLPEQSTPVGPVPPPSLSAPLAKEKSGAGEASRSREKKQPPSAPAEIAAPTQSPNSAANEPVETRPLFQERRAGNLQSLFPIDPRGRARGVISGTPVVNPAMPRIGTGTFSPPSELETDSLRTGSLSLMPLADYELVVRRRPPQQDQALRDNLSASRKRSEAAAADRPQPTPSGIERLMAMIPDSTRPQTVWVSLAPSQFQQFKKDLVSLGTIESESTTSFRDLEFASKTESEILIKLTILPGSETNRGIPTVDR
jgi:hypothetical protein